MNPVPPPVITLKAIAACAGVAKSSVSYALRNHPKIPAETRERIQRVAHELGYRPNIRVAGLMAHIRRAQAGVHPEQIAFVWVHTTRAKARSDPFLRETFVGAEARARQMGIKLEEFFLSDSGMTDLRLGKILRTRGIVGVVLSPVMTNEAALHLNWEWDHFAPAVIGNVAWTPELHHAGHHHFLAMCTVMKQVRDFGCRRPATLIEASVHERSKHATVAAFLAHHPQPAEALSLVRVLPRQRAGDVAAWVRRVRPDVLIVSEPWLLRLRGLGAAAKSLGLPLLTLRWNEQTARGIGGIDQCNALVAASAIDLVVAQLNSNETGVPAHPRMMLFPGRWVAPPGWTADGRSPARADTSCFECPVQFPVVAEPAFGGRALARRRRVSPHPFRESV